METEDHSNPFQTPPYILQIANVESIYLGDHRNPFQTPQYIPTSIVPNSGTIASAGTVILNVNVAFGVTSVNLGYIGSNIGTVTETDNGGAANATINFASQTMPGASLATTFNGGTGVTSGYRNLAITLANAGTPGWLLVSAFLNGFVVQSMIAVTI